MYVSNGNNYYSRKGHPFTLVLPHVSTSGVVELLTQSTQNNNNNKSVQQQECSVNSSKHYFQQELTVN
jgi:hypothetical protein